jgi:hypothetical protein
MNNTCPISNFTSGEGSAGISASLSKNLGRNELVFSAVRDSAAWFNGRAAGRSSLLKLGRALAQSPITPHSTRARVDAAVFFVLSTAH